MQILSDLSEIAEGMVKLVFAMLYGLYKISKAFSDADSTLFSAVIGVPVGVGAIMLFIIGRAKGYFK